MRSAFVCLRRYVKPATRICRLLFQPLKNWRSICIKAWWWCLSQRHIPARRAKSLLPKLGIEHGLTVGEDWFLAFSPERVDPAAKIGQPSIHPK